MVRPFRLSKALIALLLLSPIANFWAAAARGQEADSALRIRRHTGKGWADGGHPVPREAARVFTYEGSPRRVHVTDKHVACDYGVSGVLFDAGDGKMLRRYTNADGWPEQRPPAFGPKAPPGRREALVDPGVVAWRRNRGPNDDPKKPPLCVAAEVRYRGRTFRARQPALKDIQRGVDWRKAREKLGRWEAYLQPSGERSCVEAVAGGKTRRYTTADGLAGNIVSHLAVCGDALWAACVDVYDDQRKAWGFGGLCRYDSQADRWVHVKTIGSRRVRWVTLLQADGRDLWVGFREGDGITGRKIVYGMGLYPGLYRPIVTAVVLARLRKGRWAAWSRKPLDMDQGRSSAQGQGQGQGKPAQAAPTEIPRTVAPLGDSVLLYSETRSNIPSGNFSLPMDGQVSVLDLRTPAWRRFDARRDFHTHRLTGLHVQGGRAVLISETNAHLWHAARGRWVPLETHCTLPNPAIQAVTSIGEEVWVGYSAQSHRFAGVQGISRYHVPTGRWRYLSPKELGTSCGVRAIVAGPGSAAWVWFAAIEWHMGAMSFPRRESPSGVPPRRGLGRFAEGKWEFPLEPGGVPREIERSRRGPNGTETWKQALPIQDLAGVGGAVFVSNLLGVYAGPGAAAAKPGSAPAESGAWRRIYDGPVQRIMPSPDGRALRIIRYDAKRPGTEELRHDIGRYDPKTGKLAFRRAKPEELRSYFSGGRRGRFLRTDSFPGRAVRLPAKKPGDWYVTSLYSNGRLRLVETPRAFWIAMRGHLLRIDRAKLPAWVGR